jgi:hypothetical protein
VPWRFLDAGQLSLRSLLLAGVQKPAQKQTGERLPKPAFGFMMTFHPGRQDRDAEQGREQHRDNP